MISTAQQRCSPGDEVMAEEYPLQRWQGVQLFHALETVPPNVELSEGPETGEVLHQHYLIAWFNCECPEKGDRAAIEEMILIKLKLLIQMIVRMVAVTMVLFAQCRIAMTTIRGRGDVWSLTNRANKYQWLAPITNQQGSGPLIPSKSLDPGSRRSRWSADRAHPVSSSGSS